MKAGHTSLRERKPNEKQLVTIVDEMFHARFRIQLRYDDLPQAKFFRICMEAYEKRDPEFVAFLNKHIEKSNRRKVKIKKDFKEKKEIEENFALNEEEIKDIFDVIATENPDL